MIMELRRTCKQAGD